MRKYVAFKQNITAVTIATKCICGYDIKNFKSFVQKMKAMIFTVIYKTKDIYIV